jgi:hypothetical protein
MLKTGSKVSQKLPKVASKHLFHERHTSEPFSFRCRLFIHFLNYLGLRSNPFTA